MHIRLLYEGDEIAVNDFHNRIYRNSRTIEQWRWEFSQNTFTKRPIPYSLVDDNGRIVGTKALIPIKLIDRDGVFWAAKSEETLVDPDYRGKKLFPKMMDIVLAYAEAHSLAFIWAFTLVPKEFKKLSFETTCMTSQLLFPLSSQAVKLLCKMDVRPWGLKKAVYHLAFGAGSLLSKIKKWMQPIDDTLTVTVLDNPPAEAGEICERFIRQFGGITIYRDDEYLRWRLYENPYIRSLVIGAYQDGKLNGWIALAMDEEQVCFIVDIFAATDGDNQSVQKIVMALLFEALERAVRMGAVAVRGWHVNNHPFDLLVKTVAGQLGFYHVKQGNPMMLYQTPDIYEKPYSPDDWYVNRIFTEGVLG